MMGWVTGAPAGKPTGAAPFKSLNHTVYEFAYSPADNVRIGPSPLALGLSPHAFIIARIAGCDRSQLLLPRF